MLWQVFRHFPAGRTLSLGCVCAEAQRSPCTLRAGLGPQALTVSPGGSEHGAPRVPPCLQAPLGQSQAVGTGGVPVLLLFWTSLGRAVPSSSRVWELPTPWALVEQCW